MVLTKKTIDVLNAGWIKFCMYLGRYPLSCKTLQNWLGVSSKICRKADLSSVWPLAEPAIAREVSTTSLFSM